MVFNYFQEINIQNELVWLHAMESPYAILTQTKKICVNQNNMEGEEICHGGICQNLGVLMADLNGSG